MLGISSAVAAYGSFVIPQAFKESIESTGGPEVALYGFLGYYVVCLGVTFVAYLRPSVEVRHAAEAWAS